MTPKQLYKYIWKLEEWIHFIHRQYRTKEHTVLMCFYYETNQGQALGIVLEKLMILIDDYISEFCILHIFNCHWKMSLIKAVKRNIFCVSWIVQRIVFKTD